uniref:TM2 domain-containing protein n=1 Tax=viral metagenome TaxID=1070528 RepID=A0A6C0DJK5_9ZZZZ
MLDVKVTQGSFWKGAQIPYIVYILLTIFTGLFGLDHLALRSPLTAILKFLSIIPLLGFWYFYDIAQALGEREYVEKYGIAVPFYGPTGIGAGIFSGNKDIPNAPKDIPGPWRYFAYVLTTCMFFVFPVNKFVLGDYIGGILHIIFYILFPLTFIAIAWSFYDIYHVLFRTKDLFEKGVPHMVPASYLVGDYFRRNAIGPFPPNPPPPPSWFQRLFTAWAEVPIAAGKTVSGAIDLNRETTVGAVDTGIKASQAVIKEAANATAGVGRGVGDAVEGVGQGVETAAVSLGQAVEGVGKGVNAAAEGVGQAVSGVGTGVNAAAEGVGQAVDGVGKGINSAARGIGQGIESTAVGVGKAAEGYGRAVDRSAEGVAQGVASTLIATGKTAEGVGQAVVAVADNIGQSAQTAVNTAAKTVTNAEHTVNNAVKTVNSIEKGINSAVPVIIHNAEDAIPSVIRSVQSGVNNIGNSAQTVISNVGKGAQTAISNVGKGAQNASTAVSESIEQSANAATSTAEMLKKLPAIGDKIASNMSDPDKIVEAAKKGQAIIDTTRPPLEQAGGALALASLTDMPSVSTSVLLFSVALIAFSGYVFYTMRNTYTKPEKSDDPPSESRAIRGTSKSSK